jgi:hypothetical protein
MQRAPRHLSPQYIIRGRHQSPDKTPGLAEPQAYLMRRAPRPESYRVHFAGPAQRIPHILRPHVSSGPHAALPLGSSRPQPRQTQPCFTPSRHSIGAPAYPIPAYISCPREELPACPPAYIIPSRAPPRTCYSAYILSRGIHYPAYIVSRYLLRPAYTIP